MNAAQRMHHIDMQPGDVGRYVFLPGDPGRTEAIAARFENARQVAYKREYRTFTGTLLGEKVSVTSTGIGNPSAAIAIEELIMLGADTFIRVGTSGAMQPHIMPGDLAIVSGAVRDEGTSKHYLPVEFPAVPHLDVLLALRQAAQQLGLPHHVGFSHSKDSFYAQHAPERMPIASELQERWQAWTAGGAICAEMESAILFILGSIYRKRVGSVLLMAINQTAATPLPAARDQGQTLDTAIEAMKILIQQDHIKEQH
ncbi:MAG: nucleoside phosphorylase [Anaerolineales bacterium]|nr:nucleoside phosphorylase [Anaerolineales bacterium]MCW5854842.1 nucleoside phosphorylase [Anaerolineales bacterium]